MISRTLIRSQNAAFIMHVQDACNSHLLTTSTPSRADTLVTLLPLRRPQHAAPAHAAAAMCVPHPWQHPGRSLSFIPATSKQQHAHAAHTITHKHTTRMFVAPIPRHTRHPAHCCTTNLCPSAPPHNMHPSGWSPRHRQLLLSCPAGSGLHVVVGPPPPGARRPSR